MAKFKVQRKLPEKTMLEDEIKLILFDLGGVLIEVGDIAEMWADKKDSYSSRDLWDIWLNNKAIQAVDCGNIDVGMFLKQWKDYWRLETPLCELEDIFLNIVLGPYTGAMKLVEDCRKQYEVGCLSNMTEAHWPKVKNFGFENSFDHVFISSKTKLCKPDPKAYELVLEECGIIPTEILFLDDNVTNLIPAEKLGFKVLNVKTAEGARDALTRMNII